MTEEPRNTTPAQDTPPAPTEAAQPKKKDGGPVTYVWGLGRRKTSVARVRITPGSGKFMVNGIDVDKFFCVERDQLAVRSPLEMTGTRKATDVFVNVQGGGTSGQAGAVVLGLSRALFARNPDFGTKLKEHDLLTRDPRKVERKKYGRAGARRRFQFSKR